MPDKTESRVKLIYAPVLAELDQVKQNLIQLAQEAGGAMTDLLDHVVDTAGKKVRPALTILASHFHPNGSAAPIAMATAVELLHVATLIHDDMVDNSAIRRGQATLSSLWGRNIAVLVGDYVFAASAVQVCSTENIRVIRRFSDTIMELSSGELHEIFNANNWRQTRQDYFDRIYRKTASLFRTASESGAILSGAPERIVRALHDYGYNIGMAFQIVDDILDFEGTEQQVGKPTGNDLRQGTITLPALLLLDRYPNENLLNGLGSEDAHEACIARAVEMVQNSTIIQDSYSIAKEYVDRALMALNELPDNRARQSLTELAHYVTERRK